MDFYKKLCFLYLLIYSTKKGIDLKRFKKNILKILFFIKSPCVQQVPLEINDVFITEDVLYCPIDRILKVIFY